MLIARIVPSTLLKHMFLPSYASFEARVSYRNSTVSSLKLNEAVLPHGMSGHPSASAHLFSLSQADEDKRCRHWQNGTWVPGPPLDFAGYRLNAKSDFGMEFVTMDQRAVPALKAAALDFRTECFTAIDTCTRATQLRPVPNSGAKTFDLGDFFFCN